MGKDLSNFGLNKTREEIVNKFTANGVTHGGNAVAVTDATEQGNLVARVRGFAGTPGYVLQDVTAPADAVTVVNSRTMYTDGTYTVIFQRKLATSKPTEDTQFNDLNAEYPFSVAVMDFDGKNHPGSPVQRLKFRP
jgi:hypothetical protein